MMHKARIVLSLAALTLSSASVVSRAQSVETPPQTTTAPATRARDSEVNWALPNVSPDSSGRVVASAPVSTTYIEIPAVPVPQPPRIVRQRVEIYGAPRIDVDAPSTGEPLASRSLLGSVSTNSERHGLETRGATASEPVPSVTLPPPPVSTSITATPVNETTAAPSTPSATTIEPVIAPRTPPATEPTSTREPLVRGIGTITALTTAPPASSLVRIETTRRPGDGVVDTRLPRGRAIANLSGDACLQILRERHIAFEEVDADRAEGVRNPIRVTGSLAGVEIAPREDNDRVHDIMDCRMAVAVLAWAPALRQAGVRRIEHYSIFRPHAVVAGTSTRSGHANALAFDSAVYYFDNGSHADVLSGWGDRTRGDDPCGEYEGENAAARTMRRVVCSAIHDEIFEIVLTPHYDRAHQNHVHLELRPDVNWAFIH